MVYSDYALICKALGDETRIKIFDNLRTGKKCACKLLEEFNCTQPTLSYHMKLLVESGLVLSVKDGKWCNYSIDYEVLKKFKEYFDIEILQDKESCCD